jgi:thiol-disulfide isomerase/thioredoxin
MSYLERMPARIFSLLFDHPLLILGSFMAVALIALFVAGRPRRWFIWVFDGMLVVGIIIAGALLFFFTSAARALDHRLESLTFATAPAARWEMLEEYRGRVVVVNYWATWCGPCVHEIPALNRAVREFGGEVVFLAVTDEDFPIVETFVQKNPIAAKVARFTSAPATGKMAAFAYGARPTTVVIDREGKVTKRMIGARSYGDFERAIRAAL